MKLDSIVYDYNSLQSAIAEQLNNESPTFKAIYPSDTATSLVNVLASYGSMLQYQLVSAMANMYVDSAYSEAGIYQLAETLGNRLHGNISSQVYCNITRKNLKGVNVVIPKGTKFTVEDLNFFNPENIVFPITSNDLYRIKLVQGIRLVSEQTCSGVSNEKIYFCDDFKCNTNMVKVYVNGEEWNITESFLPYVITDTSIINKAKAVILKTDSDGKTYIKFGNNTNGIIPDKGSIVRIEYISNEGANGNLDNNNLTIRLNTPIYYTNSANKRERLDVDITAVTTASGGFNTQSIEVLRESSPYVFGSGQRAVRREDYKSMLLNKCGYLTCNVWGEYEEAAIQGGYDKIMMNMVYYSGIKSIQKYDLQPIRTLELDITDIASTLYALAIDPPAQGVPDVSHAGWYVKKDFPIPRPDGFIFTGEDYITQDYNEAATFKTRREAEEFRELAELTEDDAYIEQLEPRIVTTVSPKWLDNPDDPKRDKQKMYPVAGNIEGARGFLGSYVIDISSFDIDNNIMNVKYRDKQGTGILTCDPSINKTLENFEAKIFPTNDLIKDKNPQEDSGYNFEITQNQDLESGKQLTKILVEDDQDFKTSGKKSNQDTIINFNNPYQIKIKYVSNKEKAICAFAFKTPSDAHSDYYKYFPHQIAIYGTKEDEPKFENIKNDSTWTKLSGMQTFDIEIEPNTYSDWVTTNVFKPESSTSYDEEVTASRTYDPDRENWIYTIKQYVGEKYTYTVKVNGETRPRSSYVLNAKTGELIFNKTDLIYPVPGENDSVWITATEYKWTVYKHYVIEVYSVHDSSLRSPQSVALKQIKALYQDSISTIDYLNNNVVNLNIPFRYGDGSIKEEPAETKLICLPERMEFYEYTVTLNNIDEQAGYKIGDILKWTSVIDNITYTFTVNIVSLGTQPRYDITLQTRERVPSANLRGKSNLNIINNAFNPETSITEGTGGTISISSKSTINIYGSYTGNFYTDIDIQAADLPTINKYNHFTTYLEFKQPLIKNVVIEVNVEYENVTNYQTTRNNIIVAINKLFELQPTSIGKTLNVSDIWKAINSVEGVKRFNVLTPQQNIDTLPYELLMLPAENLIINDIINSEYK